MKDQTYSLGNVQFSCMNKYIVSQVNKKIAERTVIDPHFADFNE